MKTVTVHREQISKFALTTQIFVKQRPSQLLNRDHIGKSVIHFYLSHNPRYNLPMKLDTCVDFAGLFPAFSHNRC